MVGALPNLTLSLLLLPLPLPAALTFGAACVLSSDESGSPELGNVKLICDSRSLAGSHTQ